MVLYGYLAGCFFLGPYRLVTSCGNSRHYCDSEFLLNTTGVFHDFNLCINPHQTTKISEGIELFGYRFRICIDPTGFRDLPVVILPSCGQCSLRWSGQTWMHSFFSSRSCLIIRLFVLSHAVLPERTCVGQLCLLQYHAEQMTAFN